VAWPASRPSSELGRALGLRSLGLDSVTGLRGVLAGERIAQGDVIITLPKEVASAVRSASGAVELDRSA